MSRLGVRAPKRQLIRLSVDGVARFWSGFRFRTARDLAIVGLMLLEGLHSAEVLSLNEDGVLLSEARFRARGRMMLDQSRQRVEGCAFVFHRYGERIQPFGKAWHTACKDMGVVGKLVHDLRRTGYVT